VTITESYEKAFTAANVKKEQAFNESDLSFCVRLMKKGREKTSISPSKQLKPL
jgi:hypothetical protein